MYYYTKTHYNYFYNTYNYVITDFQKDLYKNTIKELWAVREGYRST